jgi:ankyrin repeat protein
MNTIYTNSLKKIDEYLFKNIEKGNLKNVQKLILKGANIKCIFKYNYTPLLYAISHNHIEIIRLLLEKGANVNEWCSYKMSAILLATSCSNIDIINLLLEFNANINDISEYGYTPIHIACILNKIDIVELYLQKNANIYLKDNETPIITSIYYRRKSIIELLLLYGSNINDTNSFGETVYQIANRKNFNDCLDILYRWQAMMFIIIFMHMNLYNELDLLLIKDMYEYCY